MKVLEEAGMDYGIITISQPRIHWELLLDMLLLNQPSQSPRGCWFHME